MGLIGGMGLQVVCMVWVNEHHDDIANDLTYHINNIRMERGLNNVTVVSKVDTIIQCGEFSKNRPITQEDVLSQFDVIVSNPDVKYISLNTISSRGNTIEFTFSGDATYVCCVGAGY
jgi:alpha-glucuronidase